MRHETTHFAVLVSYRTGGEERANQEMPLEEAACRGPAEGKETRGRARTSTLATQCWSKIGRYCLAMIMPLHRRRYRCCDLYCSRALVSIALHTYIYTSECTPSHRDRKSTPPRNSTAQSNRCFGGAARKCC